MPTKRFERLNSNRKLNFARLLPIRQSVCSFKKYRALCLFILVTFLLLVFLLVLLLWRNFLHVPCPLTDCPSLADCPLTDCPLTDCPSMTDCLSLTDCPDTKPPMSLAQTPSTSRPPPPSRCPNNSMFTFSSVVRFSNIHLPFVVKVPLGAGTFPCAGRSVLGVVLVMSRRNAAVCREGIRRSWGGAVPNNVIIRFVIGNASKAEGKLAAKDDALLDVEQQKYGDLIRYDLEDSYRNLHLKIFVAFEWQMHFCPNAEFVMKTDDDTVVDLARWKFWVDEKFRKQAEGRAAFFGFVMSGYIPIREVDSDWYVSEKHFPGKLYPDYMQGGTYFGTGQAVRAVMAQTSEVVGFSVDDALYTGILAEHVKPPVVRFQSGRAHFRGNQKIVPQNEQCKKGVPFIFAAFSGSLTPRFKSVEDYKRVYEQIHTAKCKSSATNETKTDTN
uniref:Hexosyltransferase n=1 Tax=Globodera rostochiensis TaxID=31243 RepID=A0A914I392_GLORO